MGSDSDLKQAPVVLPQFAHQMPEFQLEGHGPWASTSRFPVPFSNNPKKGNRKKELGQLESVQFGSYFSNRCCSLEEVFISPVPGL